ncbi:MAG: ATP-binding protein [Clostridia bacterium]|nr:ATP-binding protein [Clostridia bacterium]
MSFTDETAKKVREEFDRKRKAAHDDADARRAILYSRIPMIETIDKKLANTGLEVYKSAVNGENIDEKIAQMKRTTTELKKMRAEIMRENGFDEKFTDVIYECAKCSDTGYDGMHNCECFRRAMIKEAYLSSGLGGMLEEQSFESFSLSYYSDVKDSSGYSERERMSNILESAKLYAERFGNESAGECKNLIFFGGTGLGKTHLSTSIAKKVIEKGMSVVYDTASNILSAFEADKFSRNKSESLADKYLECDLLIIDDLGAEFKSQLTEASIYNLLNARICAGKAMIISTNLDDGKALMKAYNERITSRLLGEFRAFSFVGSDIRFQKRLRAKNSK